MGIPLAFGAVSEVLDPLLLGSHFPDLLSVLVWQELTLVVVRAGRVAWQVATFGVGCPRLVGQSVAVACPRFLVRSH